MKNLSSQEHKAKTSVQPEMLLNHSESFLEPLCTGLEAMMRKPGEVEIGSKWHCVGQVNITCAVVHGSIAKSK
jgi:hypothetical protein